jgi:predicted ATPase
MTQAPVPWISKLRIDNFKSIESADLDLGPLTVLVGANSAGKSSVLQTVVLLSQIVRGRSQSSLINLNGDELQLGTFTDINHSPNRNAKVSLSIVLNVPDDLVRPWRYIRDRTRRENRAVHEIASWGIVLGRPNSTGTGSAKGRPDSTQIGSAKLTKVQLETMRPEGTVHADFVPTRRRERLDFAAALRDRIRQYLQEFGFTRSIDTSKAYDARLSGQVQFARRSPFDLDLPGNLGRGGKYFSILENGLPRGIFAITPDSSALAEAWLNGVESQLIRTDKLSGSDRSRQTNLAKRRSPSEFPDEIIAGLFPKFREWVEAFDEGESPEPVLPEADLDRFSELLPRFHRERIERGLHSPVERALVRELSKQLVQERPPQDTLTEASTQFDELVRGLRDRMSNALWYLGPLREDPSPAYRPGQGGGIARLGLKGEYTVPELERFGSIEIEAMLPPDPGKPFSLPVVVNDQPAHEAPEHPLARTSLKEAVDRWMTYLGVASAVRARPTGRAGIELGIVDDQTGDERNLTNVGVGVSQLLPVVVMCLRAQRGDVVLMEQPELHLHPAPQQQLADFLLAMSVSGRQLIVETHSEYLINRLRLRIAEDDGEFVSNLVRIIYAERVNGKTNFRPITPNTYGSFDDWPDNFFDQAPKETELILRAAMDKRKRQRAGARDGQPTPTVD